MNKKHFNGAYYFKEIFMAELKKELPSDPFDLFKFIIKIITILAFYFTGIKFFNWLYSASPQKIEK